MLSLKRARDREASDAGGRHLAMRSGRCFGAVMTVMIDDRMRFGSTIATNPSPKVSVQPCERMEMRE